MHGNMQDWSAQKYRFQHQAHEEEAPMRPSGDYRRTIGPRRTTSPEPEHVARQEFPSPICSGDPSIAIIYRVRSMRCTPIIIARTSAHCKAYSRGMSPISRNDRKLFTAPVRWFHLLLLHAQGLCMDISNLIRPLAYKFASTGAMNNLG